MSGGILWVRNDVRLHDHPALAESLKQGVTKAVFISTPQQWHKHNSAGIKIDLLRRHLIQLYQEFELIGIELVHLQAADYDQQVGVLVDYCRQQQTKLVFANRELELYETKRDQAVSEQGIHLQLFDCQMMVSADRLLTQQNSPFKVFSAYKKAWLKQVQLTGIECVSPPNMSTTPDTCHDKSLLQQFNVDYPLSDSSKWPLSSVVMARVLPHFFAEKLPQYAVDRDYPAIKGTSGCSPYLAIGAMSVRWLAKELIERDPDVLYDQTHEAFSWLNELIWRDFYKYLLVHFPRLIRGECFVTKYQSLPWLNQPSEFEAWCTGRTGYPIVDAAMRQLISTGWMHNRLRMIVASFLTKHLLIDWRWGERFFMSHLIDGDYSANNGGWQWAASTGCDAQPYFRMFNPILQSKKFDPNGEFIRSYLPELEEVPDKYIHFPHQYLQSEQVLLQQQVIEEKQSSDRYWPAIVDHNFARNRALAFFKQL